MVNQSSRQLDAVFSALSDSTRRGILATIAQRGELSVSELAEPYAISAPAISRHLRVLEEAGLIKREKHGRVRFCTIRNAPLDRAAEWLDETRTFWEGQLDALARYFREETR